MNNRRYKCSEILKFGSFAFSVVAAAMGITRIVNKSLIDVTFKREESKTVRRLKPNIGKSFTDKYNSLRHELAKKLSGIPTEKIEITGFDKTPLTGHLYTCENPERIIIAMHGWRSDWKTDFGGIAEFLHNSNCIVLFAEQRAQGESGGDFMSLGILERYDCRDWAEYAKKNIDGDLPIYLAGVSMGASTVLMASGLNLPKNIHGIIADCGYTSAGAIWEHIMNNNLHMIYKLHKPDISYLYSKKFEVKPDELSTTDILAENDIPVLFIHGTDDRFVPIEMTFENYKACKAPKRLFVVPGAGHATSCIADKDGYEKALTEFWNDFDKNS